MLPNGAKFLHRSFVSIHARERDCALSCFEAEVRSHPLRASKESALSGRLQPFLRKNLENSGRRSKIEPILPCRVYWSLKKPKRASLNAVVFLSQTTVMSFVLRILNLHDFVPMLLLRIGVAPKFGAARD